MARLGPCSATGEPGLVQPTDHHWLVYYFLMLSYCKTSWMMSKQDLPFNVTWGIVTFSVLLRHGWPLNYQIRWWLLRFFLHVPHGQNSRRKQIMISSNWCTARSTPVLSHSCLPHLEHMTVKCHSFYQPWEFTSVITMAVYIRIKCHPFYPPWEFTLVITMAVYIPPHADTSTTLCLNCMTCSVRLKTYTWTHRSWWRGTLTRQTAGKFCWTFISTWHVETEEPTFCTIVTPCKSRATELFHNRCLGEQSTIQFSSCWNINKSLSQTLRRQGR